MEMSVKHSELFTLRHGPRRLVPAMLDYVSEMDKESCKLSTARFRKGSLKNVIYTHTTILEGILSAYADMCYT